ncbi:glycine oxidase [Aureimonas jatrophae]|uniref:Glycine oxidase n=2 Tax=Aureimonas jatrophae TaxID=1166073 RepID=A0A1H0CAX9_9HYPH|nr:glycine oxidase [Aureimonas jatrophae]SDN55038.1 glycine oxidase [Aureimonas jatrophae]
MMPVAILGAGVAGLTTAVRLAEAGREVVIHEATPRLGLRAASWLAGGMLAPRCEAETAGDAIVAPGLEGIGWWRRQTHVDQRGTLVLAAPRDGAELRRFASRTSGHETLDAEAIADLEPDLDGRFSRALFFPEEAHLDPRRALGDLARRLEELKATILYGSDAEPAAFRGEIVVDCRGRAAEARRLRGVRGEMLLVRCPDVALTRPVRLLHPRWPIYVVPRGDGLFMVGATTVESENDGPVTVRSTLELLSAVTTLHPAFAEGEILETGAARRPALPDNLPTATRRGSVVTFAGLYRHGFLLSPHVSAEAARLALEASEFA